MKKNLRNLQIVGVGALTPALMTHPQAATARAIDPIHAVQIETACPADRSQYDAAKALLANTIFGLSSVEKLNLGSDRIPLLSEEWWKRFTPEWKVATGTTTTNACSAAGTCGPNVKPGEYGPGKTAVDPALTGGTNAQKVESPGSQVTAPKAVMEPKVTAPEVQAPKVNIQK